MHLIFVEKELPDGRIEISIVEGKDDLRRAINGEFVFPEKMILTKEQKEENMNGLRDLLSGAFCFQDIPACMFTVKNEQGEQLYEYSKSLYDDLAGVELPTSANKGEGEGEGEGSNDKGGCCEH